eukprot:1141679-Pelagomonas_calceolata.AAC.5
MTGHASSLNTVDGLRVGPHQISSRIYRDKWQVRRFSVSALIFSILIGTEERAFHGRQLWSGMGVLPYETRGRGMDQDRASRGAGKRGKECCVS